MHKNLRLFFRYLQIFWFDYLLSTLLLFIKIFQYFKFNELNRPLHLLQSQINLTHDFFVGSSALNIQIENFLMIELRNINKLKRISLGSFNWFQFNDLLIIFQQLDLIQLFFDLESNLSYLGINSPLVHS